MKTYRINTDGTGEATDSVIEKIESLAHELRSQSKSPGDVIQGADAIMHLAADIKFEAERTVPGTATRGGEGR